jgi:hypothetical protein
MRLRQELVYEGRKFTLQIIAALTIAFVLGAAFGKYWWR